MEYHVQFCMEMKGMGVEKRWKSAEEEKEVWRGGEIVECMEWDKWQEVTAVHIGEVEV
jgi:hypothetical protein